MRPSSASQKYYRCVITVLIIIINIIILLLFPVSQMRGNVHCYGSYGSHSSHCYCRLTVWSDVFLCEDFTVVFYTVAHKNMAVRC